MYAQDNSVDGCDGLTMMHLFLVEPFASADTTSFPVSVLFASAMCQRRSRSLLPISRLLIPRRY